MRIRLDKKKLISFLLKVLPLVVFLLLWELLIFLFPGGEFFYSSPSRIIKMFWEKTVDGSLWIDTLVTSLEAVSGFIIGNLIGAGLGLLLWFSQPVFKISKPYIIALGSAPVFALSPILVLWFGIGVFSKIVIVVLSTVFVALLQAYNGADNVREEYKEYFQAFHASKWVTFKKLILPSSLTWVISAFKLNTGFALLGAFIGEYISSNVGLGHMILVSFGNFNMTKLLLGVIMMSLISLMMNKVIDLIEGPLRRAISRI